MDRFEHLSQIAGNPESMNELLDTIPCGVMLVDAADHRIAWLNREAIDLIGLRGDEIIGHVCHRFVCPADTGKCPITDLNQEVINAEKTLINGAGENIPILKTARLATFGGKDYVIGSFIDYRQPKKLLERLRISEETFRAISVAAQDGLVIMDVEGRIIFWNPAMVKIFGYEAREALNRNLHLLLAPDRYHPAHLAAFPHFTVTGEGGAIGKTLELHGIRKGGEEFPLELSLSAVRMGAGWHAIGIIRDITRRRKLEEDARRVEKLRSVGLLAGGLAHHFNNHLGAILGNLSLVEEALADDPEALALLQQAERASFKARDIAMQLLVFSTDWKPLRERQPLAPLVREVAGELAMADGRLAMVDAAPGLPDVAFDAIQMGHALRTVIANALEYTPDGAEAHVRVDSCGGRLPGKPQSRSNADKGDDPGDGQTVRVTVLDRGPGMSREQLAHLFEPFYTTKTHGSGLSLASARSIIEKHGGRIAIESATGAGTTVTIDLPAAPPLPAPEAPPTPGPARARRILIMDDDDMIRDMLATMLRKLGHETTATAEGETALSRFQLACDEGRPFDLVFLDLVVPGGLGGRDTFDRLRAIDPGVRAVVSSGYSRNPDMAEWDQRGFVGVLPKPYKQDDLRRLLDRLLPSR